MPVIPEKSNAEIIWEYLDSEIKNPYGVAGVMGNLEAESGLIPNNLQNTGNRKLDISDSEYTKSVDDGVYPESSFISDGFGYGLAQWTYSSRKKGLYNFAKSRNVSIGNLQMQ